MAPEAKKIAEHYVQTQLKNSGNKPAQKKVQAAVRKVAAVIEEIRSAATQPKAKGT